MRKQVVRCARCGVHQSAMPAERNERDAEPAPPSARVTEIHVGTNGMDLACAAAMTSQATRQINEVLAQHRDLLDLAARIEALVDDESGRHLGKPKAWRAALAQLLAEFTGKLESHFEAEVQTTSFDPAHHDHVLAAQLRELDEEHRTLRRAFEQAHHLALSESTVSARVREHTLWSISAFREHEAKEDALFSEIA